MRRLRVDNLGTLIIAVIMTIVIVINGMSLVFYALFRGDAAVAAAAGQAADQLIAINRLVERVPTQDRATIIRRLNSPGMVMAVTRRPIVTHSDDTFSSRVVQRRLAREFRPGTEIYVDSRIERESPAGDRFPSNEEVERQMRDTDDRMPDDHRLTEGPATPPVPPEAMTAEQRREIRQDRRDQRMENIMRSPPMVSLGGSEAIIRVSIRVGDEAWFNSRTVLAVNENPARNQPIVFLSLLSLVVAAVSLWGVKRATKPLALFASAAERLGVDFNAEPLDEKGPGEVRRAARALNTMQTRLKRFIHDRTQMLAAISHDLRTPITRMKLRAEFVDDDEQRDKMLSDLDDMEKMISATLAFARDDAANEPTAVVNIAMLLKDLAADEKAGGRDVTYSGPADLDIVARPLALKRAVSNLVDNAVKYGKVARVMLTMITDGIEIIVEDEGPGIPDSDREKVFAPFFRLEGSRSRETGGTGLGLTITRNNIRSMGGDIELSNLMRDGQVAGLRARVILPITQED
jgi:signal transduction histidine kinase